MENDDVRFCAHADHEPHGLHAGWRIGPARVYCELMVRGLDVGVCGAIAGSRASRRESGRRFGRRVRVARCPNADGASAAGAAGRSLHQAGGCAGEDAEGRGRRRSRVGFDSRVSSGPGAASSTRASSESTWGLSLERRPARRESSRCSGNPAGAFVGIVRCAGATISPIQRRAHPGACAGGLRARADDDNLKPGSACRLQAGRVGSSSASPRARRFSWSLATPDAAA